MQEILQIRHQQVLHDQKWKKLLKRTWVFKYVPFVDFAFAAGSLATGNVHEDSDFDVIVGAREGRIFTARFLLTVILGALGWRRAKLSHHEAARDKICLNHFVTKSAYRLSPPHNIYWKNLYQSLVPIYGNPDAHQAFWDANADLLEGRRFYGDDLRHRHRSVARVKSATEFFLGSYLGNFVESGLRKFQIARIAKSLTHDPPGYAPRITYNDSELEFHPDTKRIEEFSRKKKMPRF